MEGEDEVREEATAVVPIQEIGGGIRLRAQPCPLRQFLGCAVVQGPSGQAEKDPFQDFRGGFSGEGGGPHRLRGNPLGQEPDEAGGEVVGLP